jgi:hypothetical protein
MDQIKKQIDFTVYWVRVDQKKMKLLTKGKSKKETKKIIKNIINDNNLNNAKIFRLIIKFYNQKKFNHWGPISFNIFNYNVKNNKLIKINEYGKVGIIWFEKKWLINNGWNNKYISHSINLLRKNKAEIIIPGINYYHLFGLKL